MNDRVTKKELLEMYKIDRSTFDNWVLRYKLPIIEITSHKKFIRREDLIEFENSRKR
jgi:hypothetical protein